MPDFILNLTYQLGFGEHYEVWEKAQRDVGQTSKVWRILLIHIFIQFTLLIIFLKIRHMLEMWRSYAGTRATTSAMIEAMKKMPGTKDIVDLLKNL